MEFLAAYWWLWLILALTGLGLTIWKWITGVASVVGDVTEIAALGVDTVKTVTDGEKTVKEKTVDVASTAVDKVKDRATSKVKTFGIGLVCFILTWFFGILFLISMVLNVIDYAKG